ncbi:MAG: hypothetical protein ACKO37_07435 [Vampirovibrionales bacterium]
MISFPLPLWCLSLLLTALGTYAYTKHVLKREHQAHVHYLQQELLQFAKGYHHHESTHKQLRQELETLITFIDKKHMPLDQLKQWVIALKEGLAVRTYHLHPST